MPYYGYGYYGFDWTYLVIVLPCILLSMWASTRVNSTFKRYSNQISSRRITGADAAQRVLGERPAQAKQDDFCKATHIFLIESSGKGTQKTGVENNSSENYL